MEGDVLARDHPTLIHYLNEINEKLGQVKDHVKLLYQHVQSSKLQSKASEIDLLELKNQLLLSYLIDLSHVVWLKCGGVRDPSVYWHDTVDRILEDRVVLEKIRPLEQRFRYQLDKLLRAVSSRYSGGEQPLQFKPAPENLISKVAVENQEASMSANEGDLKENASGLYVPPRVMAMPYKDTKVQKLPEKTKLISELRDELTDFPTEVHTFDGGFKKRKLSSEDKLRESYEEEHMTRLTNRRKPHDLGRGNQQHMEDLVDFSLFKGLTRQRGSATGKKRRKAIKTTLSKKRTGL